RPDVLGREDLREPRLGRRLREIDLVEARLPLRRRGLLDVDGHDPRHRLVLLEQPDEVRPEERSRARDRDDARRPGIQQRPRAGEDRLGVPLGEHHAVRFLPPMSASIHPAPLKLGPYELQERIATGGMAEVYLARRAGPHGFQKVVAVKRILPQLAQDHDFVAMFVDEARVCARLAHPNIVQVFDFGEETGELYMAMEFVDGTTAARLVRAAATRGDAIPLDAALYIALSILRGLDYAHNARDDDGKPLHLVHRDVSPGNVLIDRSGAVKLTDFGIARAAEIERRTDAGQLKGKLGYMSPEQVVGKELDARSDLFTAAIVLAELVMLRPLFAGPSEIDVLMRIRDADLQVIDRAGSRVPDDVKTVLIRAMARERALRYPSAAA